MRDGHDVCWFIHWPKHSRDWLQNNVGNHVFRGLAGFCPDVVIAAEYPYPMLRTVADAPVVTVRHSLASRGNTWEPEQAAADYVVTWSEYDEQQFERRGVPVKALRGGCVWASRFHQVGWTRSRSALCNALGLDPAQPIAAWCPTWNPAYNCADVVTKELAKLFGKFQVLQRIHGGADHSVISGPWDIMWIADVLVSDVSGLALLALCAPALPVVQVDPPMRVLEDSPQYDPEGPEWEFRDVLGPRVPEGKGLADAIVRAHKGELDLDAPAAARDTLVGTTAWTRDACRRTTDLIVEALRTGT
jgi:hypothetical protein